MKSSRGNENSSKTLDFLVSKLLPQTSRTFVKPIHALPHDLQYPIGVAYNLLRLLDTLEDTPFLSSSQKKVLLQEFPSLLQEKTFGDLFEKSFSRRYFTQLDELLKKTPQYFTQDVSALRHAPIIIQGFYFLPHSHQHLIFSLTQTMSEGFQQYLNASIKTFEELDNYCYYAAGIVGEYLTQTFHEEGYLKKEKAKILLQPSDSPQRSSHQYSLAHQTGIFLQLVNITRDIAFDKQQGRNFYPLLLKNKQGVYDLHSLHEMIRHTLSYAPSAFQYLRKLPFFPYGLRAFVALPYYLAQESLLLLANNTLVLEKKVKLTRKQVMHIARKVMLGLFFPPYLKQWHQQNLNHLYTALEYAP